MLTTIVSCGNEEEFVNTIPEVKKVQHIEHPKDWINLRYGEIIPIFKSGINLYIEAYNSIGSNLLPQINLMLIK